MNKVSERKGKMQVGLAEILYFFSFGIMFAAKGVGLDYGQKLFTLCICFSLLCLAGKLWLTKHTAKEWLVMLLLVLLGVGIYLKSGEQAALAAMLVIIGMKNVPLDRLFKVCLGIWGMTFALSCTLGILHIRDGVVVVHQKLGLGPLIRWSLGYTHPNVLHVSYFVLASLLLYAGDYHGKKLWRATTLLFVGNILVFLYSVSYTGVLIMTGYLALNVYLDMRKSLSRPEKFLLQCILPFCVLFPLIGPFVTSGKVFDFFNKLLSTRFELVKNFFTNFTPSLLGTRAHFDTTAHLTLDSSFAYLLMYYGIIAFVIFVAGYFFVVRKLIKEMKNKELAIMIAIIVAGVTEQFLFNLSFKNLSFFFLGEYFFEYMQKAGNRTSVWNREIRLPGSGGRDLCLPDIVSAVKRACANRDRHRTGNVAGIVIAAFLAAVICAGTVHMPESVYVNRGLTEYKKPEEEVSLDLDRVPEGFNSMVIGYEGPEAGMYCFSGNIIKMEYVRNIAGAAVLGAFAAWLCTWIHAFATAYRKGQNGAADRSVGESNESAYRK